MGIRTGDRGWRATEMSASRSGAPVLESAGFFVLRTPLLPQDELTAWSSGLGGGVQSDAGATLAADRARLRQRLRAIVARPEVREALFLASPSLDASLAAWLEEPESPRGQKIERTLVRYFLRMTSRPTPFGLFAGCSVGTIGERTDLSMGPLASYRRHLRLDRAYLSALTERLGRDPAVRPGLRYRLNDSAYRAAGQLRYAEARSDGTTRRYVLTAVETSEPLEAAIACGTDGAPFAALVDAVAAVAGDLPREAAAAFVHELIDAQVLVAELDVPVTGEDPLADLIGQLRTADATAGIAAALDATRLELARLRDSPLGAPPARYRRIADRLQPLPADVELSRLFHVDLVKPAPAARLGRDVIAEIAAAAELLRRLAPPPRHDELARFRDAFVARYEEREVPLTTALDEDLGIGFARSNASSSEASPLLEGLAFGGRGRDDERRAGPHFSHLLSRLAEALGAGAREIVLGPADVEALTGPGAAGSTAEWPLPDSLAALVTLVGPSAEAVARGELVIWLHSLGGPPGARLLGRFCHADPLLAEHVRAHLAREEAARPDALFAELVHLPDGRTGNIVARPVLRQWEVPFVGRSGAPRERQLPVDDLLVFVRDGRVRLRSRRLGREVIVRLTTAHHHATSQNLDTYRFLCALQTQEACSLSFGWGALGAAPFLPRVRWGRIVLSPARWRLGADALRTLWRPDRDETFRAVQRLRSARGLPRWVAVVDGDQALPIDLDNVLAVEAFAHLVHRRSEVALTELLGHDGACAHGPEGRFTHELIVPLEPVRAPAATTPARRTPAPARPHPAAVAAPRSFPPGTEWLYAKLYAGAGVADDVLRDVVAAVVAQAREHGAADRWFFVRYADPEWHLRVRFHGEPARLHRELLPMLTSAAADAVARGLVWRVQLDTYEREVERYGGATGVALAEELFCADSDAVLELLRALRGEAGAAARWRLLLRGMDQLADDLGLSLERKLALVRGCRDSFARELGADAVLERRLGDKFRTERPALEALLAGEAADDPSLASGLAALTRRSERIREIAARLRSASDQGALALPVEALASSYLHMHANRVLRGAARAQELVLYDFLERLYTGRVARRRQT